MDYNNYYSPQTNHPPPPSQSHGGGVGPNSGPQVVQQQQQQQQPQQQSHQMMRSPMPQQNTRQTIPPGQPSHHQQQQQSHLQHQSYQQIHLPHGPPVSHSNQPLLHQQQQHQTQHQHHNHQSNMTGSLPQQTIGSQHVLSQSPHHQGPMPPHMQSQQPITQMVRPQIGPAVINHHQSGINQPLMHHQQNFFSGGPMPQPGLNYHPQSHHHQHLNQAAHHHIHHQLQSPLMHHVPPPHIVSHFPHNIQQGIGRSSPYFLNILQTEFRVIEFNRRLQCRPLRYPNNPMPSHMDEHSLWWDKFASDFFEDDATLTLRLALEEKPVEYTIGRTLIPRFFRTYFDGGVADLSINMRNPKETYIHPHMITLDCDQTFIVTNNIFKLGGMSNNHGVVVHTEGHLSIDFVSNNFDALSIKSWRFYTRRSHEYIDRALLTTLGLPTNYFAEPITRQGLTKSTVSYLKMCMIMGPMQELMHQHKQTKMDPRSCLRKLLFERYKFRSGEDNRAATNKRRKRKPPSVSTTGNAATNKKSKAGLNNPGLNNNLLLSPSTVQPNFSLASQDVMVVGEPSMMGGDFGDDNERMITRLENTQYDPSASAQSNIEEISDVSVAVGNDNPVGVNTDQNHVLSPNLDEQSSYHQARQTSSQSASSPLQVSPDKQSQSSQHSSSPTSQQQLLETATDQAVFPVNLEVTSQSSEQDSKQRSLPADTSPNVEQNTSLSGIADCGSSQASCQLQQAQDNHKSLKLDDLNQQIQPTVELDDSLKQLQNHTSPLDDGVKQISPVAPLACLNSKESSDKEKLDNNVESISRQTKIEDVKITSLSESVNGTNMVEVDSLEQPENHTSSIQAINDESSSSSQLVCPTADNTPAMEQQQPVDNGVA